MIDPTNWSPEHSDALREYIAKGTSYGEIAKAINRRFSTGYSRSAVIGRAKRMGLAEPDRLKPPPGSTPVPSATPRVNLARESHFPESSRWFPISEPERPVKLRCVALVPRHLSLTELERGDCRYPYGGDEDGQAITFCGHPKRLGSSYCSPHFHLSRGEGTPSERAAGPVLLKIVETA